MAITWPAKNNYATGDVLTATNMNGIGDDLNALFDNSFYAGKNKIINGDFGIWQRGTSFSNPSSGAYTTDRFSLFYDGTGATRTITQQTFTPATAPVAGYEGQYFWRSSCTVAGSGGTYYILTQPIEDVRTFAGQTVTVSFWVKADTSRTLTVNFNQNFGSGGSATVYGASSNVSATTSWARVSATIAVASISGKTIGTGSSISLVIGLPINATHTVDIWGVQVEAGSTATPFQTATGTIQGELAACQRYAWVLQSNFDAIYGMDFGGGAGRIGFNHPTTMRASASYSLLSGTPQVRLASLSVVNATPSLSNGNTDITVLQFAFTGGTIGTPLAYVSNSSLILFSAEL